MEPVGSHTTADLLAPGNHLWHRQRRHCRSQSAHFFLCHRHRLLAADRRVLHEHDRTHTTRLNAHLGCTRRPIRYQEGFLCSVYDPGSGASGRHIERRYSSRLCRLFSLRHRSGRELRASRSHLGQFLRPHLSGNGARTVAFLFTIYSPPVVRRFLVFSTIAWVATICRLQSFLAPYSRLRF